MGVAILDLWASRYVKSMPITSLKDSVIGIDATHYLERLLVPSIEPLLSALGGYPLALESTIVKELDVLKAAGVKAHFVFSGLDYGIKDDPFKPSIISALANAQAFQIYENDMANEAINVFRTSGTPGAAAYSEYLKRVLHEHNVEFTVAPYSALAQLAYYEKDPSQFIDAIYGPSELFLYGVDKLITKFDYVYTTYETKEKGLTKKISRIDLEDSRFSWIDRRIILEELGHISVDIFVDACLLAGSNLLYPFPPLENPSLYAKGYSFRDVVNLIISCGRSIAALCAQHQEDPRVKDLDYLDRYRRVVTGIRHHIIITKDGNVETLDAEHAPSDVHECIGQRLPEELIMYLSRGMLRPRVLNWLTSGKILITAPPDGGSSLEYQNLVKLQLHPWRQQSLCLLADSVHRYYQRKEVTTKFWFDEESVEIFNLRDLVPSPKESLRAWHVRESLIFERRTSLEFHPKVRNPGSLFEAVRSLSDAGFASRTFTSNSVNQEPLKSATEITTNVIWRFLQLRGYVDNHHHLTMWGSVLDSIFMELGPNKEYEEAAFLAVELLRLNLLNARTMFPEYSGAPMRGTETDRYNCMLVSRVACLGKLRHQPKGYSGPLSRHLLAYHSMVSTVQISLRDLIEMNLATIFLEGAVDRNRGDWMGLSLGLPFYEIHSCALGIACKTYLDELSTREDPTLTSTRTEMKQKGQGWVINSDFARSLEDAFTLWDAVYKGVLKSGDLTSTKDRSMWNDADQWLSMRR